MQATAPKKRYVRRADAKSMEEEARLLTPEQAWSTARSLALNAGDSTTSDALNLSGREDAVWEYNDWKPGELESKHRALRLSYLVWEKSESMAQEARSSTTAKYARACVLLCSQCLCGGCARVGSWWLCISVWVRAKTMVKMRYALVYSDACHV